MKRISHYKTTITGIILFIFSTYMLLNKNISWEQWVGFIPISGILLWAKDK